MEDAFYRLSEITDKAEEIICCTGNETDIQKYIAQRSSSAETDRAPQIEQYLSELFARLGMPASLRGYEYLMTAISIAFGHQSIGMSRLYRQIALISDTKAASVERAMRHAITVLWERGDATELNNIFGRSVSSRTGKVTNSEFIARIIELIKAEKMV